eukprot:3312875-Pyramimonas_sp.AAC.1
MTSVAMSGIPNCKSHPRPTHPPPHRGSGPSVGHPMGGQAARPWTSTDFPARFQGGGDGLEI